MRKLLIISVLLLCTVQAAFAATGTFTIRDDGETGTAISPVNMTIAPGDTVVWENKGERKHDLRINGTEHTIRPGASYSEQFDAVGRVEFNVNGTYVSFLVEEGATITTTQPPAAASTSGTAGTTWGNSTNNPDLLAPADFERKDLRISKESSFEKFALRGILFFLGFLGVLMLIMMVLGGYYILIDRGTEEKYTQGKTILTNAIIGLVLIILSYAMINELLSSTSVLRSIFSIFG